MKYRTTLICSGIPFDLGDQAARDVEEEFSYRPWHSAAKCTWNEGILRLRLENDFDANGGAASDEFSDALSACLPPFDGEMTIESVEVLRE